MKVCLFSFASLILLCQAFAEPAVRLLPSPFLDNLKRERAVMESLDPMNLTWTCRVTAGLDDVGNTNAVLRLGGWERPDMELRGHTLGHWLSGMKGPMSIVVITYDLARKEMPVLTTYRLEP